MADGGICWKSTFQAYKHAIATGPSQINDGGGSKIA